MSAILPKDGLHELHAGTAGGEQVSKCVVCAFDFSVRYGPIGEGFIHVHPIKPLSEIGKDYVLDPIRDLRPVCPNCHAMLHRLVPAISIEKLQELLGAVKAKRSASSADPV
ncbi:MAG: HNH endonuclease [Burkholderiaceae bacterium]|nr:HNH endonuclease [Burkholderiaceae bacterium]